VYGVYRLLGHRAQNVWLLAASYYFYAVWDWRFTALLAATTLVSYGAGLALERPDARADRRTAERALAGVIRVRAGAEQGEAAESHKGQKFLGHGSFS